MNRRLAAPDHSLNAPVRQDSEGEWQDWLVDGEESQETALADREELTGRKALARVWKASASSAQPRKGIVRPIWLSSSRSPRSGMKPRLWLVTKSSKGPEAVSRGGAL